MSNSYVLIQTVTNKCRLYNVNVEMCYLVCNTEFHCDESTFYPISILIPFYNGQIYGALTCISTLRLKITGGSGS